MKNRLTPRVLFSFGFVVLIATNIMVISRVVINRAGTYETMIELTERELSLPYRIHQENSGISLQLKWRALGKNEDDYYSYDYHYQSPDWLDKDKLASLGFKMDTSSYIPDLHKQIVPRQAYIVLEYDGEPYQKALKRSQVRFDRAQEALKASPDNEKLRQDYKYAEDRLQRDQTSTSRLFAVDAGLNAKALRKKYPDWSKFIVAPGLVELNWSYKDKKPTPSGYVSTLLVESIHVPLEFRQPFDEILSKNIPREDFQSPRYTVHLAYGTRFEPWIKAVKRINEVVD